VGGKEPPEKDSGVGEVMYKLPEKEPLSESLGNVGVGTLPGKEPTGKAPPGRCGTLCGGDPMKVEYV